MHIQKLVLAGIMVMFLATGNAWAEDSENSQNSSVSSSQSTSSQVSQTIPIQSWLDQLDAWREQLAAWREQLAVWRYQLSQIDPDRPGMGSGPVPGGVREVVPEIDAASGTSAIVLLVGALLLAGERSRSRRS
jgi:hypothetical protein